MAGRRSLGLEIGWARDGSSIARVVVGAVRRFRAVGLDLRPYGVRVFDERDGVKL